MAIGWIEKESRSLRVTTYATKKGVWDVDYHCELNLIGGGKFLFLHYHMLGNTYDERVNIVHPQLVVLSQLQSGAHVTEFIIRPMI